MDGDRALEADFLAHLIAGTEECRRAGYNPTAFRVMLDKHGAVGAVQRLLSTPPERHSEGFTRLWELKLLRVSAEYAVAFDPRFESLFTDDERGTARERLALYGERGPRGP